MQALISNIMVSQLHVFIIFSVLFFFYSSFFSPFSKTSHQLVYQISDIILVLKRSSCLLEFTVLKNDNFRASHLLANFLNHKKYIVSLQTQQLAHCVQKKGKSWMMYLLVQTLDVYTSCPSKLITNLIFPTKSKLVLFWPHIEKHFPLII